MNSKADSDFSSLDYWRDRHDKFKLDPTGVGNVAYDADENEQIYIRAKNYISEVVKNLPIVSTKASALDLGCGIGKMTTALTENAYFYTGVDISPTAVEIAQKQYPKSNYIVGNIAKLPFHIRFNIILERTVFIHLVEQNYWESVLSEVKRLLKDDGVFILQDYLPLKESDAPKTADHVTQRTYSEYEEAFAKIGMKFDLELRESVEKKMSLSPNTHFVTHI